MNKPTIEGLLKVASVIKVMNQGTGELQPWSLYSHQKRVLQALIEHDRSIWLKARQLGISTLMTYYVLMLGVMNRDIRIAVVADKFENSIGLLDKIRDICKQLTIPLEVDNQKQLKLVNGTTFDAITVNSALGQDNTAGRSKTFHVLLLSEAAYYNNSHAVFASLTSSAIPDAIIIVESTATPAKNMFRSLWDNSNYYKSFISMEEHDNYVLPENMLDDTTFKTLQEKYGFRSRRHAAFWNNKLHNEFGGDINRLLREYPVLEAHSWSAASGRFIDIDPKILQPIRTFSKTKLFHEWGFGGHYIFGVDVSAGVGRDYSSIVIYDLKNKVIAGIYHSNTDKMDAIAAEIKILHQQFKPHNVYIEKNGIGGFWLIPECQKLGVPVTEIITTEASKYSGLLLVKQAIERDGLCADDHFSSEAQALTYEMNSSGTKENFNHAGDSLMACSFCLLKAPDYHYIINSAAPRQPVPVGHFDMQRILDKEEKRRKRDRWGVV
jgi:hypothetical protein